MSNVEVEQDYIQQEPEDLLGIENKVVIEGQETKSVVFDNTYFNAVGEVKGRYSLALEDVMVTGEGKRILQFNFGSFGMYDKDVLIKVIEKMHSETAKYGCAEYALIYTAKSGMTLGDSSELLFKAIVDSNSPIRKITSKLAGVVLTDKLNNSQEDASRAGSAIKRLTAKFGIYFQAANSRSTAKLMLAQHFKTQKQEP